MYRIEISPYAKRELLNIAKRHKHTIAEIIEELKDDPYMGKSLTREFTGRYSYKVGVYRIIYKVSKKDKRISILTVGHRATIYK